MTVPLKKLELWILRSGSSQKFLRLSFLQGRFWLLAVWGNMLKERHGGKFAGYCFPSPVVLPGAHSCLHSVATFENVLSSWHCAEFQRLVCVLKWLGVYIVTKKYTRSLFLIRWFWLQETTPVPFIHSQSREIQLLKSESNASDFCFLLFSAMSNELSLSFLSLSLFFQMGFKYVASRWLQQQKASHPHLGVQKPVRSGRVLGHNRFKFCFESK